MHSLRPWIATTLCLALLALAAPAAHATPATDESGSVITTSWLDRIQDAFATLLPWTASAGEDRPEPHRSTRSGSSWSGPAPSYTGVGDRCDPTTTEFGCTNDPDG